MSGSQPTSADGRHRLRPLTQDVSLSAISDCLQSIWLDEDHYRASVLRLASAWEEEDLNRELHREAEQWRVYPLITYTNTDEALPLEYTTTSTSDPGTQSSCTSLPTARSSYEVASCARSSQSSSPVLLTPSAASVRVETDKRSARPSLRNSVRRLTGLNIKKRKQAKLSSLSFTSASSANRSEVDSDEARSQSRRGSSSPSPAFLSARSSISSGLWSDKILPIPPRLDLQAGESLIDHEALRRSMECPRMIALRARQVEERTRFLNYQASLVARIRDERDLVKAEKRMAHAIMLRSQTEKNERAVEGLELRQLEEEVKLTKEQEERKRTVHLRLRHMEAYCQTPLVGEQTDRHSPWLPHSRNVPVLDPPSMSSCCDSAHSAINLRIIPRRTVTDKDYHSLASQYRERDAMDDLHSSRINVLRGRQRKQLETLVLKKERELNKIIEDQMKELEEVDRNFSTQEAECKAQLYDKKITLERKWKLQSAIEKLKVEKVTGLKHELLPDITADDNGERA